MVSFPSARMADPSGFPFTPRHFCRGGDHRQLLTFSGTLPDLIPNGDMSSSPGLARSDYPGKPWEPRKPYSSTINLNEVVSCGRGRRKGDTTPLGLAGFSIPIPRVAAAATLGWRTESRWDSMRESRCCKNSKRRSWCLGIQSVARGVVGIQSVGVGTGRQSGFLNGIPCPHSQERWPTARLPQST
jgi:hypothetical protein